MAHMVGTKLEDHPREAQSFACHQEENLAPSITLLEIWMEEK